jgi:hypothetical protein
MRLVIRQFGGAEIAEVKHDAAGRLRMDVWAPHLEDDLRTMLDRLGKHSLPLRTDPQVGNGRGVAGSALVRQVSPPDPDFLQALVQALPDERIDGRRLRGVLMEG